MTFSSNVLRSSKSGAEPPGGGVIQAPYPSPAVSGAGKTHEEVPVSGVSELRVALTVDDFDRALAFYRDALGLTELADWSSETGRVVLLGAGRATLELLDGAQAETVDRIEVGARVSGTVRLALEVDDSEQVARRLVAGGGEEVAGAVVTPWGDRNARVRSPDGMQLTLFTRRDGRSGEGPSLTG